MLCETGEPKGDEGSVFNALRNKKGSKLLF